jgi:hypothetical protein
MNETKPTTTPNRKENKMARTSMLDLGTHFCMNEHGNSFFVFTLGTCERCGADVQEPNAIGVHLKHGTPADHGLTEYDAGFCLAEIWPNDDRGGYDCDCCREVEDEDLEKFIWEQNNSSTNAADQS